MMKRRHHIEARLPRDGRCAAGASFLACAALVLFPVGAAAHAIGLSRGDYLLTAQGVDVTVVLARAEVTAAASSLEVLAGNTIEKIRVTAPSGSCAATAIDALLTEQDGVEIRARYVCPPSDGQLTVTLALLDDLSHGHRHAARVTAGAVTSDHILFRKQATFAIDRAPANPASLDSAREPSAVERGGAFVRMGIEHILTGYDHLLFLFALVLGGGTLRSLALAVTAFTVAHSVTLALAVLGFLAPPAQWIEPAVALSVAYVGVENFFRRAPARHWITFSFGLVHGFGFAGALREIAIPRGQVPWALSSFNVGVEVGQLAWMLVAGIVVTQLRRWEWFGRRAVAVMSAGIVVIGLVWFVGRLYDPALALRGMACANRSCG
jgi:hydrogenase/urease accessory protein HupE